MSSSRPISLLIRSAALLVASALAVARPAAATAPPVSGASPAALVEASRAGLFRLDPRASGLTTQSATGTWRVPVILVSFADDTVRYTARDFERLLFDTTHAVPNGSVAEYYSQASGGRLKLTGRVVASVRLPQTAAYYANGSGGLLWYATPRNDLGFARDALRLCQASVAWPQFDRDYDAYVDMVWFVHAGFGGESGILSHLWSVTSRMSSGWSQSEVFTTSVGAPGTGDRYMLIDRFTVLPELSLFYPGTLSEIGVFCHEFGHALGLPDLYDVQNPANTGPGNWSLMSSGAYGGDGHSSDVPVSMGAWPLRYLGWDHMIRPTRDTTVTLGPLAESPDIVDVWLQGADSPEHFMVERRARVGYDRNLPGEGLIVYHVNEWAMTLGLESNSVNSGPIPGLALVEADADDDLRLGHNRGDAEDPFPGSLGVTRFDDFSVPSARAIAGQYTNLALEDITPVGNATRFHARVFPAGWLGPEDRTGPGHSLVQGRSPARASGTDAAGVEYLVESGYVDGRSQIVMRSSLAWDDPLTLSQTTRAALDPSLAIFPDGDLAVVWSDSRRGRSEIYYRGRIRGTWMPERAIVSLPGDCRSPSIANDARGGLYLAFQYQNSDTLRLMFERFNYVFPTGQPVVVSGAPQRPETPVVLMSATGDGYVVWHDRRPSGSLWAASFHPDSGVGRAWALTSGTVTASTYAAALDSSGTLHVAWNIASSSSNEVRYVTHNPEDRFPQDVTVLVSLINPIDALAMDTDPENSVHLVYGVNAPEGLTLSYIRRWPDGNWDVGSTDLSYPAGYRGRQPIPLPRRGGNVDIAYTDDSGGLPRFMVRRRTLTPEIPLAVGPARPVAATPAPAIGPNPARFGESIRVSGAAPAGGAASALEVFDTSGRRVASLAVRVAGARWEAEIPGAATSGWNPGVYFARPAGTDTPAARFVIVR